MDDISFSSEYTTYERVTQNTFYCGYDCDTMVNNVFTYHMDSTVFFCAIKFPGSWRDRLLTVYFLAHIMKWIGNYKIYADQRSPRSGAVMYVLDGPVKDHTVL
jgi:hypothetical protein